MPEENDAVPVRFRWVPQPDESVEELERTLEVFRAHGGDFWTGVEPRRRVQ
jgi:hypothetical protein